MHYPQQATDSLATLSELPYFLPVGRSSPSGPRRQGLGQAGLALPAFVGSMARTILGGTTEGAADTDQSAGMPGSRATNKSAPRQPQSLSTVSTAVVTQVSPQISPVMTQQQSSPGATVGADPTQFMPGGLSAEQAITPYGGYGMPGFPTNTPGISPMQPYTYGAGGQPVAIDPGTGRPITGGYVTPARGALTAPVNIGAATAGIPWLPIALIGGVAALAFFLPRRKRQKAAAV